MLIYVKANIISRQLLLVKDISIESFWVPLFMQLYPFQATPQGIKMKVFGKRIMF